MIDDTEHGVLITIRVIPRAAKSQLSGSRGDALVVRLNAPPVDGAANAELIRLLADVLKVPKRAVAIVTGERSVRKRVRVSGVDRQTVEARLLHYED